MSMGIGHSSGAYEFTLFCWGMDMTSDWEVPLPSTNRTLIEAIHITIYEPMGRVGLALLSSIYTITRACLVFRLVTSANYKAVCPQPYII